MTPHTFMMLFDDSATSMLEAVMLQSMNARFPGCRFKTGEAPSSSMENTIIPIVGVATDDGKGSWVRYPPDRLRADVSNAFSELLREARAARPS